MIQKISRKFRLTEYESYALLTLLSFLAGGVFLHFTIGKLDPTPSFDYSVEEKLFQKIISGEYPENNKEIMVKDIDSLSAVSEFNRDNLKKNKISANNAKFTININNADIDQLCRLPGIGIKTAQKIIELRNRLGKFTSVNQLLTVKGIGDKKLDQIKPYISF